MAIRLRPPGPPPPSRHRTRYSLVKTADGTMILLSAIESFCFDDKDDESKTFNRLANDITGVLRTKSGAEYSISIKDNAGDSSNLESVKNDIIDSWIDAGCNHGR